MQKMCQCSIPDCPCTETPGPAIVRISNIDGERVVCSRCVQPGDETLEILFENVQPEEQASYDPEAFLALALCCLAPNLAGVLASALRGLREEDHSCPVGETIH